VTPLHADIAFVLEGLPDVREVYALERTPAAMILQREDPATRDTWTFKPGVSA
jgi:hypothetical protein